MIRRRAVLAGIAGALASRPLAAQTRPRDGMRRLGVLMANHASDTVAEAYVAALTKGLHALDWHEGRNLRIVWRWTGGAPALFDRYATELAALRPDVLLAQASPSVSALKRQTSTIPIVFTMVSDPVGQGFAESFAHPGGNVTGFSDFNPLMAGKWLEILTQMTPPVARVAVLYNPETAPYAGVMMRAIEDAAPSFAVAVRAAPCRDDAEIEAMMAAVATGRPRRGTGPHRYLQHRASRHHHSLRRAAEPAHDLLHALIHFGRRLDVVWHRLCRSVSRLGRLY